MKLDYDDISPITGNKSVLREYDPVLKDTVKMCMESGYQTYLKAWRTDNANFLEEYESTLPVNIKETKFEDSSGNVWYKTVLQSPRVLLFPDADVWCVVELVDVPTATDANSMVAVGVPVDQDGNYATRYMDYQSAQYFGEFSFEDAIFAFQTKIAEIRSRHEN